MRISKLLNICLFGAALTLLAGCSEPSTYHDVNVKTFTFKTSTLAPDIKGIAFTVDTIQNIIYNLDSVSYTSDITKVVPVVTCYSTPSELRINDNYWNQVDSLNVTEPFKLTVVSSDKKTTRSFTVTVNKHTVDQDKVSWVSIPTEGLGRSVTKGRAVYHWSNIILAGEDGSKSHIFYSPDAASWYFDRTLDNTIDIRTLYSPEGDNTPDSIFALSVDGTGLVAMDMDIKESLFKMPDGVKGVDIIGEDKKGVILILSEKSGAKALYGYSKGKIDAISASLSDGFPSLGYSAKCIVHLDAPVVTNAIASCVFGGKTGGEDFVQNVFSSDNGWYWPSIVKEPVAKYCFEGLNSAAAVWYDKRLFLYGGKTKAGVTNPAYVSCDTGFTWEVCDTSERLPESCTLAYDISVVCDETDEYMYTICGMDKDGNFRLQCFRGRAVHKDFIRK